MLVIMPLAEIKAMKDRLRTHGGRDVRCGQGDMNIEITIICSKFRSGKSQHFRTPSETGSLAGSGGYKSSGNWRLLLLEV